ncbi:MAG: MSHA biogenesis protein MshM [Pseudohongiellaceae bacterium]|jgi:MSHA biogenesis protein MshM
MYLTHFGLSQHPFSLTPNTRYFFKLPAHQRAFEQLLQALKGEEKFAIISGEVGTGKTLLCRKILLALDPFQDRYLTAYIPHPVHSEQGIMHMLAEELQLPHDESMSYKQQIRLISNALVYEHERSRKVVLFIDEAQAMPEETLAALYLLTTLTDKGSSLQIILFGQPELSTLLNQPLLRQLSASVSFTYTLPPLDRASAKAYVDFRLTKAGYNGNCLFSDTAIDALFVASKGVPRLINILSHKAMIVAFGLGDYTITKTHIHRAIDDTDSIDREKSLKRRLFGL